MARHFGHLMLVAMLLLGLGLSGACGGSDVGEAAGENGGALTENPIPVSSTTTPSELAVGSSPDAETRSVELFPVRHGDKWGYIDRTGKVVVEYQYDEADEFSDGMAAVRVGQLWGYIDESGSMVVHPRFSIAFPFWGGLAQLITDEGMGYIDRSGQVAIEPRFDAAYEFHEGLAGVRQEGRYGYIDTSGEVVISLPYATAIGDFGGGLAPVRIGYFGYIDRDGDFVIEPEFVDATPFSDGLAVVEHERLEYQIIDQSGIVVEELEYDQVSGLRDGRAAVLYGGILAAFEEGRDFADVEGLWGYMDRSGELVVPVQFKLAGDFRGGLAYVVDEKGKMAYIDLDGNYVWREK